MDANEKEHIIGYYQRIIKDLRKEKAEAESDGTPISVIEIINSDLARYTERLSGI